MWKWKECFGEKQQYDKKVVNLIINSQVKTENTNRAYSTMDLYPTTLAALGAQIEGNKLALGTNLFSADTSRRVYRCVGSRLLSN